MPHIESDSRDVYPLANLVVTVNGAAPTLTLLGDVVAEVGDAIVITATLTGGAAIHFAGASLKVAAVRHADDKPTDDEVYFSATINTGDLTATGSFSRSGDWQFNTKRINKSLARMAQTWKLEDTVVKIAV